MKVTDNGKGMDNGKTTNGRNGSRNMKRRADMLQGDLKIESNSPLYNSFFTHKNQINIWFQFVFNRHNLYA